MALRRLYVCDLTARTVELDTDQAAHARKSLRLGLGDAVELFDGAGGVARGVISQMRPQMAVDVSDRTTVAAPTPGLTLAVAVPKGDRAATLVEAAAQLGVDRIVPLITERSVVAPGKNKQARFERIATEAAKQCGRAWMMNIDPPTNLTALLHEQPGKGELRLIADVQDVHAVYAPADWPSKMMKARQVRVLVGPEGGWTDAERAAAKKAGYHSWQFGPHVMRVETAALAAAAIVRWHGTPSRQATDEQDTR